MWRNTTLRDLKHTVAVICNLPFLYQTKSYAQEGEDILIAKLLESKEKGIYIDVGAHHPYRFSNTFLLYQKGWHGINIDPIPGGMSAFEMARPRDINLELGVDENEGSCTYFEFAETALNTLDAAVAQRVIATGQSVLVREKKVPVQPLQKILEKWLPKKTQIDLLNIDVEGLELKVLNSINWEKTQPMIIAVEYLSNQPIYALATVEILQFLAQHGYALVARTVNTLIFRREQ